MVLVEVGRVCIKKLGRDAGKKAVITKVIDENFVSVITSSRLKERRCNLKHLEILAEKIDVSNKDRLAKTLEVDPSKIKS